MTDMTQGKQVKAAKIPAGYERIADLAKAYFEAHESLRERADEIRERQIKAGKRLLPGLKKRIAAASAARDELRAAVDADPRLWERPRTRALHGVKVGKRQLPGALEIDEAAAPEPIRRYMPERYKALVKVETKLVKAAIKNLEPAMLERIGGRIVELGDETVIAIPKSAVDKLVEALLADLDLDDKSGEAPGGAAS